MKKYYRKIKRKGKRRWERKQVYPNASAVHSCFVQPSLSPRHTTTMKCPWLTLLYPLIPSIDETRLHRWFDEAGDAPGGWDIQKITNRIGQADCHVVTEDNLMELTLVDVTGKSKYSSAEAAGVTGNAGGGGGVDHPPGAAENKDWLMPFFLNVICVFTSLGSFFWSSEICCLLCTLGLGIGWDIHDRFNMCKYF